MPSPDSSPFRQSDPFNAPVAGEPSTSPGAVPQQATPSQSAGALPSGDAPSLDRYSLADVTSGPGADSSTARPANGISIIEPVGLKPVLAEPDLGPMPQTTYIATGERKLLSVESGSVYQSLDPNKTSQEHTFELTRMPDTSLRIDSINGVESARDMRMVPAGLVGSSMEMESTTPVVVMSKFSGPEAFEPTRAESDSAVLRLAGQGSDKLAKALNVQDPGAVGNNGIAFAVVSPTRAAVMLEDQGGRDPGAF